MSTRKIKSSWWVDFRWQGRRIRKRSPVNTRAGADEYEAVLRGRILRSEPLDATEQKTPRFEAFAETWLTTHAKTNNRPSAVRSKRSILRNHLVPAFGSKLLSEITRGDLEKFKATRLANGLSPKTINNQLSVLRAALTCAEEWGHLSSTPRVRWLKVPPRPDRFLTDDECARLLAHPVADAQCRLMVLVGLRTGLRRGELLALKWSSVDLDRRTITVQENFVEGHLLPPKNNRIRRVPIAPDLWRELAAVERREGLVFSNRYGRIIDENTAAKHLRALCDAQGVRRIGWHLLRHTFASQLVTRGVSIRTVQAFLGHTTVQMTERYAHLAPSSQHDAVLVLTDGWHAGNRWATGTKSPSADVLGEHVAPHVAAPNVGSI